ncbi:MAG TPA: hypothetical protein VFW88_06975 [Burkholderiales bacterium]|nr:hypothetical protein [Burkholderiales bacterium]
MSAKKTDTKIAAYKGFDKDLKCRDFQYEIGKTYTHEGPVKRCSSGFHCCEYPLDVFGYYEPTSSRYASVTASGKISREIDGDSKIASAVLHIEAELRIPDLVSDAVKFILDRVKHTKKGANTGNQSAATNTGNQSAATNTGNQSAATNTGDQSAATNTGNQSAATNTGNQSAATIESEPGVNKNAVAIATGYQSKAKASAGSAIVCVYRDDNYNLVHIRAGIAGKDVKPDTWYTLDATGEFVEAA